MAASASATPPLGIIMLDTEFARPLGDAGNPLSWPFPVCIERVPGAHAPAVVRGSIGALSAFVDAGDRLVRKGVAAITTTCGFLVRQQAALQAALGVPVESSALLHYDRLRQHASGRGRVAILTIDATAFDGAVRAAARIDDDAIVASPPADSHFVSAILNGTATLDTNVAEAEWVALALAKQRSHPDITLWLFECANMPPYAAAVRNATGVPVFDVLTMGRELHARYCR